MGNQTSGYLYPEDKETSAIEEETSDIEEEASDIEIKENTTPSCATPSPYIKIRSKDFCIIKYTFDTDEEEDVINENELTELDIPDEDDRETPLFTSLDEIKLLKKSIKRLEKSINEKTVIINELYNKEDDYIDELDELFIANQKLNYKLNSRRYEPFSFAVRNSFPQRRHSNTN